MRRILSTSIVLAALAAMAGTAACDDPVAPRQPVPGWILVTLATPADAEAGLVAEITGPALPLPSAVAGDPADARVFARVSGTTLRVGIFGELAGGVLFRFPVADTAGAASFTATLVEVAAPDYSLRQDLAGYGLSISATID